MYLNHNLDGTFEIHEEKGEDFLPISDKAVEYIHKNGIENLTGTDRILFVGPGILKLDEEVPKNERVTLPDIVGFRLELFMHQWDFFGNFSNDLLQNHSLLQKNFGVSKHSDMGDSAVITWMKQSYPRWIIHDITPDAATLIANARVDSSDDALPVIYLRSDKYLVKTIREIVVFENQDIFCHIEWGKGLNAALLLDKDCEEPLRKDVEDFVRKYLAIRSAEKSPIESVDRESLKLERKGIKKTSGVFRYSVSLSKRYKAIRREKHEAMDKTGKVLTTVNVSGFIRNQPVGEGRKERKLIWVDGFSRGQWVRQGITYVTIKD